MLGEPQGIFSKANSGAIPGESSENLGIMWFLLPLALPALVAGKILSLQSQMFAQVSARLTWTK